MIPFLALVRKDLKLFFNDRRAVVVGLVAPIVLASFFGYLFGGQGGDAETSKVPVLVIDQDGSNISRGLITQLGSDKNLDVKPSTLEAGREAVRKGKATAAIVIPKDFGREAGHALFTGATKPELGVLYDPSHNVELGMVKGILSGAVMQAVQRIEGAGCRAIVSCESLGNRCCSVTHLTHSRQFSGGNSADPTQAGLSRQLAGMPGTGSLASAVWRTSGSRRGEG